MSAYPLPKFHFQVEWGGTKIGFQEVTGLDVEFEKLEYREGSSPEYSKINMPGMVKYTDVVLKRGVFKGDNEFYDWMKANKLNKAERRDITISLLDEEHAPVVVWKLLNAWPMKIQSTDLKGEASEVAVESITVVHEGLQILNEG
ncbi:phage tail protein [Kordia sp.]|uniref:phage tail protein n=1 Tax=Kordia sp. TaxID=1965332 RepID=UPI003B5CD96D